MYEYEFETVEMCGNGYSLFGGVGLKMETHREIIKRRAADGWRYVDCIPTEQRASGFIETVDLVFEREKKE